MKSLSAILAFSLLFFLQSGCSGVSQDELDTQTIQGDWYTKDYKTKSYHPVRFVFSFEDSLCSAMAPFWPFCRFKVRNRILHVWQYDRRINEKTKHLKFKIIGINQKTLRLLAIDTDSKETISHSFDGTTYSDTLTFRKIKAKNNSTPTAISFYSSGCYGTCPSIGFEVDSTGNVRYFGDRYAFKQGGRKGKLSEKEQKLLLRQVHQLPLNAVKGCYSAGWTDDQTCAIAILYNGKWKTCSVYGYDKEPIELRLLIEHIFRLAETTKLTPDRSIKEYQFKAYDLQWFPKEKTIQFLPPVATQ